MRLSVDLSAWKKASFQYSACLLAYMIRSQSALLLDYYQLGELYPPSRWRGAPSIRHRLRCPQRSNTSLCRSQDRPAAATPALKWEFKLPLCCYSLLPICKAVPTWQRPLPVTRKNRKASEHGVCRVFIFKAPGSISVRQKGASFKLKEAETLRVPAHVAPHLHVYQHLAPEVRSEKMLRLVVL